MGFDMSQFYQVFFEEAAEHLDNMERLLLALDVGAPSREDLNAVFRAAHSIKGGSGTFGFNDMAEVTHILESLLDRLRKDELALNADMVDAFLAAGDLLRSQLAHHQGGPEVDGEAVAAACGRLSGLANPNRAADARPSAQAGLSVDRPAPRDEPLRFRLTCVLPAEVAGNAAALDNLLAALREFAALELEHRPDLTDPRLVACLTTQQDDEAIREALSFYAMPEEIDLHPLASGEAEAPPQADEAYGFFDDAPGTPTPSRGDTAYPGTAPAGRSTLPSPAGGGVGGEGRAPGSGQRASHQSVAGGSPGEVPAAIEGEAYGFFDDAPGSPDPSREDSANPRESPAAAEDEGYGLFIDAPGAPSGAAPASYGRRTSDHPAVEIARSGRRDTDKIVSAASEASSIRVSVEKVDQLVNLVGELVITQAMLADAAGRLDPVEAEKLLSGIDLLARNTREMQESVMSIRMLPMSMVFSRFPRVVRDVAGKLGKQVELRTVGENTELDKGLTEKITDPLTHLVRNSLDHGIETPEARVAAGKPPKGVLTLKASHQGGHIVIEVIDDGAGLNRARILAKAREKGLDAHDAMSDAEVWQLIYAPGFSTAEVVTDVSGRGVGMDVVKRNIEGMGGRVEMDSAAGVGTRTVIRLPLTLAILDGMSVGVAGGTYIIPLTAIVESLLPGPDDIKTVAGDSRVLHIRGEYLPVIALAEVLGQPRPDDAGPGIAVVVEAEEGKAALLVDELLGQHQVVIKSLEANYRRVPGISGATIMGDGRVALILDIAAVTRMGLTDSETNKAARDARRRAA